MSNPTAPRAAYAAALAAETADDTCDVCGVDFNSLTADQMDAWTFHHGPRMDVIAETCSDACTAERIRRNA